jgi:tRNA threonylcarbamoyladenosine biosynthesis protein TsaE
MVQYRHYQQKTDSYGQTEALGESIGHRLKGGEVIELASDLGGGKTTFVRGLARGAGSSDVVGSPTFMLSKVYDTQNLRIYHFDFYILQDPGITRQELMEILQDPLAVVVVEWSDIVKDVLPEDRVSIRLSRNAWGEDIRDISVDYSDKLAYLLEGVVES